MKVVKARTLVYYYYSNVCFNYLEETPSRKTKLFLICSIRLALHMSSSYHLAYNYLSLVQIMWSRHLKSYPSILGENRPYSAYLMHKKWPSNKVI